MMDRQGTLPVASVEWRVPGALELELASANLSMYLRMTPPEDVQMEQVRAALDRLDRQRDALLSRIEGRGLRAEADRVPV